MKPFSNAYDAIKKLFRKMFGKKDEEQLETTEEELAEAAEKEAEQAAEATEATETAEQEAPAKEGKKAKEPEKAIEDVLASIADEEGIKEEKVSKGELEEQKKYEEEVRKRAERKAKREAEDRKKEAEEAASAKDEKVKMVTDPVTGEEVPLGQLPAEATFLKKYMRIQTTSDDVLVAINSILKHPDMPKNVVVLGRNGFGTVKVGEDFARSFYELGIVKSDKIAKTKAKQLNKMGLEKLSALKGGCLIIENAGLVSFSKLVEVIKDSAPENNDYVVILTGEIDSLANFFDENDDIVDEFIYLIDIHKIKERGMMHFARGYVKERGYKADKAVYDKLKASLKAMEEGNIDRFVARIDEVIEKCDKREAGGEATKNILPEDAN
jgi:Membrane protein involved in colicin uptake